MIVALSGGVGGAKLAWGLSRAVPPERLTVIVNTADDFEHLHLYICPDLDTVTYTLSGMASPVTGWGVADDTSAFMAAIGRLGGPEWFMLGDRDLALHVLRSARLRDGESLTRIAEDFCKRLGVVCSVLPMSDDRVRTVVHTTEGMLDFQEYFVRRRCEPRVNRLSYEGAMDAGVTHEVMRALSDPALKLIAFCPSNPFLSIDPILAIPKIREAIDRAKAPKIAVSPIIAGAAVKGPAAKIMGELGLHAGALGIAHHYRDVIDCIIVDTADAAAIPEIQALGIQAVATATLMRNESDRLRLASYLVNWRPT